MHAASRRKARSDLPPRPLPIVGDLPAFMRDPLGHLLAVARRDGDVGRLRLLGRTTYLLSHPDDIRRVLRDEPEKFSKRTPVYRAMATVLGDGLLTSEGSGWLAARRLIQRSFHRKMLEQYGRSMPAAAEALADRWTRAADRGETVDVYADLTDLTLRIVLSTLLGSEEEADVEAVGEAVDVIQRYANRAMNPFQLPLWVPLPLHREHRRAMRALDRITYRLIDEAERRAASEGAERTRKEARDVLTTLVTARDERGRGLLRKQLRDEVLTLLVAGHDTTANALTWTFHLLGEDSRVAGVLAGELRDTLEGRLPRIEDREALPYTQHVVDESLRIRPPAWTTARLTVAPFEVRGVRIPPNHLVMVSPWVTHRRADAFPDPERFWPERWENPDLHRNPAYFPFGLGAHKCIGDSFARMEAQLVLATLARRVELEPVEGHRVVPEPLITLRPERGLPMRPRRVPRNERPAPARRTSA